MKMNIKNSFFLTWESNKNIIMVIALLFLLNCNTEFLFHFLVTWKIIRFLFALSYRRVSKELNGVF